MWLRIAWTWLNDEGLPVLLLLDLAAVWSAIYAFATLCMYLEEPDEGEEEL